MSVISSKTAYPLPFASFAGGAFPPLGAALPPAVGTSSTSYSTGSSPSI